MHKRQRRQTLRIDAHNDGRRVDVVLRQLLPEVPLGVVMKWLRKGAVRLDDRRCKPGARLVLGAVLSFPEPRAPRWREPRGGPALPSSWIVYEDDDLLIVDKPAGIASHPGSGQRDTVSERVERHLGATRALPGHRPGLAQRLDRDVSGLVPIGKNASALRALTTAAKTAALRKTYLALVEGRLAAAAGTIDTPLARRDGAAGEKAFPQAQGKAARTRFRRIASGSRTTLVEIELDTGRTHQIRAHFASLGHPLVGDTRYGAQSGQKLGRVFLHAARLQVAHPRTGAPLRFVSPLPEPLTGFLAAQGIATAAAETRLPGRR